MVVGPVVVRVNELAPEVVKEPPSTRVLGLHEVVDPSVVRYF